MREQELSKRLCDVAGILYEIEYSAFEDKQLYKVKSKLNFAQIGNYIKLLNILASYANTNINLINVVPEYKAINCCIYYLTNESIPIKNKEIIKSKIQQEHWYRG